MTPRPAAFWASPEMREEARRCQQKAASLSCSACRGVGCTACLRCWCRDCERAREACRVPVAAKCWRMARHPLRLADAERRELVLAYLRSA